MPVLAVLALMSVMAILTVMAIMPVMAIIVITPFLTFLNCLKALEPWPRGWIQLCEYVSEWVSDPSPVYIPFLEMLPHLKMSLCDMLKIRKKSYRLNINLIAWPTGFLMSGSGIQKDCKKILTNINIQRSLFYHVTPWCTV